ncbi:hypothetical protein BY996DRAFT_6522893 [Phakopsora pachyrhizi]|nr:hypothetical protein BY996DRAFT_6522893 [Phakopsora pachyrhizi]
MPEEGSTRVATEPVEQAAAADDILQGRQRDVDIAGPTTADNVKGLYGDTVAGPTKARMRFGGIKFVRRIRKPWEGKRPAGGRISVGLVRRRETLRRTDIGGISRAVVGRAVLLDFDIGRAA